MRILDIRVDALTRAEALDWLGTAVIAARADGRLRQVVTLNAEGVMLARQDPEFRQIIDAADLVTADGNGLLWAAETLGEPLPERVTGIDLFLAAAERAAERGWRVYFLGAAPGVAEQAAANLCRQHPGLSVAGISDGFFRAREAELLADLQAAKPDLLFAALGMPYQEKWLAAHRAELPACVALGLGGSFDVVSGAVKRAPALWQRLKLEWLWRLGADPKRWRRALALPKFVLAVKRSQKRPKIALM